MSTLRLVFGDQLSRGLSALADLDEGDVVLFAEVAEETTYVAHHPQKIVLVLSAMRHFAAELDDEGIEVDYVRLDDPANTGTFTGELERALARHRPSRVVVTEAGEWRVARMIEAWQAQLDVAVEVREDDRFFATRARFSRWAKGRAGLRMEFFYREMRRHSGLLMQGREPAGGRWNFDVENRRRLPKEHVPPPRLRFRPDPVTQGVMALVRKRFPSHFGSVDDFGWPVTREDALQALDHFIAAGLPRFGDYQDAMQAGEPWLYHSLLAPALNIGLLGARELCARAEEAYRAGQVPLNAAEGFIRQILGWREYVRGIYWLKMPGYAASNALRARRPLPALYWGAPTPMRCLSEVVESTRRHAYSHHIQRLMVTGNFALLAGVDPAELERWYLAVYADAFEWVEMPNTLGMAAYADGGLLGSKPYAASGAYIQRMSDFCKGCRFDVRQKTGARACPFNYLYWDFLIRNRDRLESNPRMAMPYRNLARFAEEQVAAISDSAAAFLATLE